jgi:heptosyltransferase III
LPDLIKSIIHKIQETLQTSEKKTELSEKKIKRVIISRTDAIGDVVLTLPLATLIKQLLGKETEVFFFGKTYTAPVINSSDSVNHFINYDTFEKLDTHAQAEFLKVINADVIIHVFPRGNIASAAKAAGIEQRIGTTNRIYHWFTCNRLVKLSRKNSTLHEAQLNVKLLKPLKHSGTISIDEIPFLYQLNKIQKLPEKYSDLLSKDKFRLIFHPKSHASAREWKLENFHDLIRFLPANKFQFIITGSKNEEEVLTEWKKILPATVINLAGKLTLDELIALINSCDGLVAASTGPLHIAAALGKNVLGLYPPIRPMDPGRWAPLGKKSEFLVMQKNCSECRAIPEKCHCMNDITSQMAEERILKWVR